MPTSKLSAALPVILALQEAVAGKTSFSMLDVGPGLGKYGLLAREYLHGVDQLDAVEVESRYITPTLWEIYDCVHGNDIRDWSTDALSNYDVVLMADVIEHMPKEDGLALIDRIPGPAVMTTPSVWFQNPESEDGWPSEQHRSLWGPQDFGRRGRCTLLPEEVLLCQLGPR